MNIKNKIWKYATAAIVILIMLNPEFAELALFIDAIGLEMFFMLIEVQFIAITGALLNTKIKLIYLNAIGGQDDLLFDGGSFIYSGSDGLQNEFPQFDQISHTFDLSKKNLLL